MILSSVSLILYCFFYCSSAAIVSMLSIVLVMSILSIVSIVSLVFIGQNPYTPLSLNATPAVVVLQRVNG